MEATTFFSYKGGAGRSTTCLNTVPFLAKEMEAYKNAPILLIDMDIESAGMTYLLNKYIHFQKNYDVKEFLKGEETWPVSRVNNLDEHPLYQKFVPVGKELGLDDDYSVMFLGVNDSDGKFDHKAAEGNIEEVMSKLNRFAENNGIRAIIMDSAAGDQMSADLAVYNSDKIVFCMRPTMQFRTGTTNYLHKFSKKSGRSSDEREIILLPTVVPKDIEIDGASQKENAINEIMKGVSQEFANPLDINTTFISENMFGINEINRFKWQENTLYKLQKEGDLEEDEKEGLRRYERLARIIAD